MDTHPRTLLATGLLMAAVIAGLILLALSLTDNGPSYPALLNNSVLTAQTTVNGVPGRPVQPGETVRVGPGTTWTVPDRVICTWHPGKAGGPRQIAGTPAVVANSSVPVTQFVTIEECVRLP